MTYYGEYMQLSNCSEERLAKNRRIVQFVKAYNDKQTYRWDKSVQCQMQRMKEDVARLRVMRDSLLRVFEAQRELNACTKSFINTERLNNEDVNRVFLNIKRQEYTKLKHMEQFATTREADSLKTLFDLHLEEYEQAYLAKQETLVCLRLQAKEDLVCMFDVYCLFAPSLPKAVLNQVFFTHYMDIIFSALVMINEHMMQAALSCLEARTQGARK